MIALAEDEVAALAGAAGAAPSGGNMQPWRLVVRGSVLEVGLDPARASAFVDVDHAGSMLALGAFVENLSLEATARGLVHTVTPLPFVDADAPLARMEVTDRAAPPPPDPRHAAIGVRVTNRQPWDGRPLDPADLGALVEAARSVEDGHDLRAVTGAAMGVAGDAIAEADVIRTFDRRLHDGMLSELRWTPEEVETTRDGIDLDTLELAPADRKGLGLMRRWWFVQLFVTRGRVRRMGRAGLSASSHLGAVTMPREAGAETLLRAGRAVQRAWLEATCRNVALQPWSILPFLVLRAEAHPDTLAPRDVDTVAGLDRRLRGVWEVPDDRRIIFVFRLAYAAGPPTATALRRDWRDFTRVEGASSARSAG